MGTLRSGGPESSTNLKERDVRKILHDAQSVEKQGMFNPLEYLASSLENTDQSQLLARADFAHFCSIAVYDDATTGLPIVLAPFQRDIINAITGPYRFVVVIVPRGHGKCLDPYTPVLLEDGTTKPIGNLIIGDLVVSHNQNLQVSSSIVTAIRHTGEEMLKITLESGKSLKLSTNHRLLAWPLWTRASNLSLGDLITTFGGIEEITRISKLGPGLAVDIETYPDGNFVAADILSHNSTLVSAYLAFALGSNPNLRIIVASNTENQAAAVLRKTEFILRGTEFQNIFRNLIPPYRAAKWTDTEKIVNRDRAMKDPSLLAMGVGSSIGVGKRSDIVLLDDIIEEDWATSPTLMRKVSSWFWKELYPTLEPQTGKVIVLGTRWSIRDFYAELLDRFIDDTSERSKIIQLKAIRDDGIPLWPERFPMEELEFIRQNQGPIHFANAYMNNPVDFASSFLKKEWLHFTDNIPSDLLYYIGIDPNISTSDRADFFVVAVLGWSPTTGRVYFIDMLRTKADLRSQAQLIKDMALQWQPQGIGIESDAAQTLLGDYFEEATNLLIQKISSRSRSKVSRIAGMAKYFESGKIIIKGELTEEKEWLPSYTLQPFVDEWVLFSDPPKVGTHDDTIDAVNLAFQLVPVSDTLIDILDPPSISSGSLKEPSGEPSSIVIGGFFDTPRRGLRDPLGIGGFFRHRSRDEERDIDVIPTTTTDLLVRDQSEDSSEKSSDQ